MTNEKDESIWQSWWAHLQSDRAGRAELRRCGTVAEAAFTAPYHMLRHMKGNPANEDDLHRLGLISVVLSHVTEDVSAPNLAVLMAQPAGDKAVVADARFRQILRAEPADYDDRLRDLVRVLRQLKGCAPVSRLAEDLWWWTDRTRRQWALDYYERLVPESSKES